MKRSANKATMKRLRGVHSAETFASCRAAREKLPGKKVKFVGKKVKLPGKKVKFVGKKVKLAGRRVRLVGKKVKLAGRKVRLAQKKVELAGKTVSFASCVALRETEFPGQTSNPATDCSC